MSDQLDERLALAGGRIRAESGVPPPLEPMLDVATRPQRRPRRWVAVAASVLAVAAIAAAVQLTRAARHTHPTTAPAVPPTITQGSTTLHYVGDEVWKDPMLDESDADTIYVYAEVQPGGTAPWGTYCAVHPVARIVSQTATAVTIAVARYAAPHAADPNGTLACSDVKLGPVRLKVVTTQPLGTRSLIDAQDGAERQVLAPTSVLKPSYLPPGYIGGQPTWSPVKGSAGAAGRTYRGPGGTLTITVGSASVNRAMTRVLEHTTVRGHPATVSDDPGFDEDILIAWAEDGTHAASVYQLGNYDQKHPALTADQLLRIANSLH